MRKENSIFEMSIIELFVIILFIVISFTYLRLSDSKKQIKRAIDQIVDLESKVENKDSLLVQRNKAINYLSDSLDQYLAMNPVDKNSEDKKGIGSGIGACWKDLEDGSSISILDITLYDNKFEVSPAWRLDYSRTAKRVLGNEIYKSLDNNRQITISSDKFIDSFKNVRNRGRSKEPPCYYVANVVDSTTTKKSYLKQERIAYQIFLLNRKYLYN